MKQLEKIFGILIKKYKEFPDLVLYYFYKQRIPKLVSKMRSKEKIRVLFILHCLEKWKTEGLYRLMLKHERFEPILGLAAILPDYPTEAFKKFTRLRDYVISKGYSYKELCLKDDIAILAPDIIFYMEPYYGIINRGLEMRNTTKSLFCFSTYAIHNTSFKDTYDTIFYKFLWHDYYESQLAAQHAIINCSYRKRNIIITGNPFSDSLLSPPVSDPWKTQSNKKKRIIYAPHHSIINPNVKDAFYSGTFLQFGEEVLCLAKKYSNKVHWAFKPHPSLLSVLTRVWGENRTLEYYQNWTNLENAQIEEGQYLDLFKYSDAMIHDCCSFICEYLYMNKPVLYLDNGHSFPRNYLGKEGLAQHYHASTVSQIEEFIQNVINGIDPMKESRTRFVKENLLPPNGKTAAENIIDAILGI